MPRAKKEEFVNAVVVNELSDTQRTNKEIAIDLGISQKHFYTLKGRHKDEIYAILKGHYASLRLDLIRNIKKQLQKEDISVEKWQFIAHLIGDMTEAGGPPSEGGGTVVVNIANMGASEVEERMDRRLQKLRQENLGKS